MVCGGREKDLFTNLLCNEQSQVRGSIRPFFLEGVVVIYILSGVKYKINKI